MLTRLVLSAQSCRPSVLRHMRRNLGVSAICCQKAAAARTAKDPIQQLFLNKIKEYTTKSQAAGGKFVDSTPALEKSYQDNLDRVTRVYGAGGQDFTKFPTFNFTDPPLEEVGVNVSESKAAEVDAAALEGAEDDDKPYWQI